MIKMFLLLFCLFLAPMISAEQIVVVVNKNNPIETLSKSEVIDIFMGKYVAYPNGEFAIPIELEDSNVLKAEFYQSLVGRSLASINAYWARLRFTGHIKKADSRSSEDGVIALIQETDLAIGYVRLSQVTPNLKVVYRLNE